MNHRLDISVDIDGQICILECQVDWDIMTVTFPVISANLIIDNPDMIAEALAASVYLIREELLPQQLTLGGINDQDS